MNNKSVIVHQRTEVLHVTVVVGVHHGCLDNIEPGADGLRDDVLQDHHEDSGSRHLVPNKLSRPGRQVMLRKYPELHSVS